MLFYLVDGNGMGKKAVVLFIEPQLEGALAGRHKVKDLGAVT